MVENLLAQYLSSALILLRVKYVIEKDESDCAIANCDSLKIRVELSTNGSFQYGGNARVIVSSTLIPDITFGHEFTGFKNTVDFVNGVIDEVIKKVALGEDRPIQPRIPLDQTHAILARIKSQKVDNTGKATGDDLWKLLKSALDYLGWGYADLKIEECRVSVFSQLIGQKIIISSRKIDVYKSENNTLLYIPPFKSHCFSTSDPKGLAALIEFMAQTDEEIFKV